MDGGNALRGWVSRAAVVMSLLALLLPAVASAQAPTRYVDILFSDAVVTADIAYGEAINSRGELETLKLDLYQPVEDEATERGLYVWVHGGNFNTGNKSSSGPLRDFVKRGWVGISVGYRLDRDLVGGAAIGILQNPDQIPRAQRAAKDAQHDAQAAIRWARAHAEEIGINPNKIGVGGISAGGITALATAFNSNDPGTSGNSGFPSNVQAAVSHAGAYVPGLQGAAPVTGDPPIAIYHGTNDEQVPYPTSPVACELTIAVLNTCEFVTFLAGTHQTLGVDHSRDFLYRHVILGGPDRLEVLPDLEGDPISALVRAEPDAIENLGVTAGISSPTDPAVIQEGFLQLGRYVLDALGIEAPF